MDKPPLEYHLEIYEGSFVNDPSISWKSSSPFPTMNVGDYIDHRMSGNWQSPPGNNEAFSVLRVEHIFWEIENSHIGHKLMVCLEIVEHPEANA